MNTKNIFKTVALAMMMPAMLLTTACSNEDVNLTNNDSNNKKGFELPVTINVTRQGDEGTTRATYNATDKKLEFSDGDKLFVRGYKNGKYFAGTLDMVSSGTFSGTIYTQEEWTGTADALLSEAQSATAMLLPAGFETPGYLSILESGAYARVSRDASKAFAATKAAAIEQFSYEYSGTYSSGTGFTLSPQNAILNFTITGLTASTEVTATIKELSTTLVSGSVTTDDTGQATFAVGIENGKDLRDLYLTVEDHGLLLVNSTKTLEAGKIYNISRSISTLPEGALSGQFTINANGDKVRFSMGNLRAKYDNSTWSWSFFPKQWDYVGNDANNTNITGSGTVSESGEYYVDLFGWSASGHYYGIHHQTSYDFYNGNFADWGNLAITNGGNTTNSGWRTLTKDEWNYIFSTRTTGGKVGGISQARYTRATIRTDFLNGVNGVIIFPDDVYCPSSFFTTLGDVNSPGTWESATKCTMAKWGLLESLGCVFLPAAGLREGQMVHYAGLCGGYWSSSPYQSRYAYMVSTYSDGFDPQECTSRAGGYSVRLVRDVE